MSFSVTVLMTDFKSWIELSRWKRCSSVSVSSNCLAIVWTTKTSILQIQWGLWRWDGHYKFLITSKVHPESRSPWKHHTRLFMNEVPSLDTLEQKKEKKAAIPCSTRTAFNYGCKSPSTIHIIAVIQYRYFLTLWQNSLHSIGLKHQDSHTWGPK